MTQKRTFKRRVRERMSKTGESYTSARKQVSAKRDRNETARAKLASEDDRVSDEKIAEKTGKTWDEWFSILDAWGAKKRTHTEIARYVNGDLGVDGWWAQTVTTFYERARGMRLKHQKHDGFEVSASKTINAPVKKVFDAFVQDRLRKEWLTDGSLGLRTSQPNKGARFDWEDGSTRVVVWFEKKAPSKTTVALAHQKLPDAGEAETMKAMWRERLADLKQLLEP